MSKVKDVLLFILIIVTTALTVELLKTKKELRSITSDCYDLMNQSDESNLDTIHNSDNAKSLKSRNQFNFQQAEDIFSEFKSNKVAFDKINDNKILELEGEIVDIKSDGTCAQIILKASENLSDEIVTGNCPANNDGWSEEVAKVAIGQSIKIKGYYSANSSSGSYLDLYKCHIQD